MTDRHLDKVDAFLAHYASPTYDPAKARAYYLKNRELKGRPAGTDYGSIQKVGSAYVDKRSAAAAPIAVVTPEARKEQLEQIRSKSDTLRKSLTTFKERLDQNRKTMSDAQIQQAETNFRATLGTALTFVANARQRLTSAQ